MPFDYEYEKEQRRHRVRWVGPVTTAALIEAHDEIQGYPHFDPGDDQILDFREATSFDLSTDSIEGVTRRKPSFGATSRRAFVTPDDLGFGLGRMFEQLRDGQAGEIRIFRDMEEAERWLDGDD